MNSSSSVSGWGHMISVNRCDRWSIYYRLRDLNIPCACPADGTLRVEVNHALALLLVRSALFQFSCSRQERVDWLERCWRSREGCVANS
ncbi:hypothetical protein HPC62_11625 [Thermoleptolyngbya sichuanensis A183]|uniref:Uncharacterized protein n=1 Tax=Thermoleptolyngbya sichuanensis A183 TaxID=2737172 RepID=A0A6M8BHX4_9CYAN|nr:MULTISPECIES: Asr1405/Asl0597 family protein [Thermoleptolyngbya]QKD82743.1 hypothetical protein HPC62_11625 [Thermoleptolyngbya sichuanensis A183]